MSDLIAQIQMAQRAAGERAVSEDLQRKGLIPADGPLRCDGCGKTIAEHDRLLRCGGPSPAMTEDRVRAIVRSEVIRLGLVVVRDAMD